jgi:hypothetical protein
MHRSAGHFFLGDAFFCDRALPATLFDFALVRPSWRIWEALDATFLLVDFDLTI